MKDTRVGLAVPVTSIPAATYTVGTETGATIDLAGNNGAHILAVVGPALVAACTFNIYEGDAANGADKTLVAAADLRSSTAAWVAAAGGAIALASSTVYQVGYDGQKRYLTLQTVNVGGSSSCLLWAGVQASAPTNLPAS